MNETGNPFRDAMLARSLANLIRKDGALVWRAIEGVGFIRGDIYNSKGPDTEGEQLSVHVWHPELYEPAMEDSGLLHDHRFAFRSVVMLGAVHDTEVFSMVPVDDDDGAYRIHEVTLHDEIRPAIGRKDVGVRYDFGVGVRYSVTEQTQRYRLVTSAHTYRAGSTFAYPAGKFHRAEVSELTVTLCWKAGQFGGGRLLARAGHKPKDLDLGIGLDRFTKDRVREIRAAAAAALESADTLPYPRPWLLS